MFDDLMSYEFRRDEWTHREREGRMEQFESKESSNVGWARYDAATQILEIDFKNKAGERASTYTYANFPDEEWQAFRAATTKGKHFAYKIRPRFTGVKKPE